MSDDASEIDLKMLMRQQGQILDEVRSLRDDTTVLTAVLMRLDGTMSGLVNESVQPMPSRAGSPVG